MANVLELFQKKDLSANFEYSLRQLFAKRNFSKILTTPNNIFGNGKFPDVFEAVIS